MTRQLIWSLVLRPSARTRRESTSRPGATRRAGAAETARRSSAGSARGRTADARGARRDDADDISGPSARGGRVARAGTTSEDEGADEAGITSRETKRLGRALEIVWLHRQGVLASVRGGTSRSPLCRPARPSRSRASKHASRSAPHVPPRTSSATTTLMRPSDQPPSEGRHLAAPRGGARRDVLGVPAPRADATPSSRARQPRPPVSLRDDARHAWGRDRHVPPPHPPREIPADENNPTCPPESRSSVRPASPRSHLPHLRAL